MPTKLEDLQGQLAVEVRAADDLVKAAVDGVFSAEQGTEAARIKTSAAALVDQIKTEQKGAALWADLEALAKASPELAGDDAPTFTEEDLGVLGKTYGRPAGRKSWGQQWAEAEVVRAFVKQFPPGAREIPQSMHVDLPAIPLSAKANVISGAGQPGLLAPDERGLIDYGPFMRPLVLRDLISNGRTDSNSVRYARVTGFTNAAAGVHEASTATGVGTAGGIKPQSDVATTPFTATVVTIAHWFAASKQSLSDIPLMQTLIDQYGRYGLAEEEEDEIIGGTGVANDQLDGFRFASGIQTQAFAVNIPDSIRKAITKVTVGGQARPNGVLMNPADAETVDLSKDGQQRYYGNGPFGSGPDTLWGLPRVISQAVPAQKAYVADFRTILFLVRQDPSVAVTDSHADFFVRNLIALLFEERACQLVFRPTAICEVTTS